MDEVILDAIFEKNSTEYDYQLDLHMNEDSTYVIKISDDGEWWNIIHPDSLEEFITKDNL